MQEENGMDAAKNLELYNRTRAVPEEAKREIQGGPLNGKTDVNPMFRIKKLTEVFGPAGKGWYTVPIRKWTEKGYGDDVAAFVDIELYVKYGEEWSKPIPGTGGSMLVSHNKNGTFTDDEAFKKAYTDAISVAAKALGVAADVYWDQDPTKYPHGDGSEGPAGRREPKKPSHAPAGGRTGDGAHGAGEPKRAGIMLSDLRNFGVGNIAGISKYLANKFGKPIAQLSEEETAAAWEYLRKKKAESEAGGGGA